MYRQWGNRVSLSYKMVIVCIVFWFVLIGHRLILYNIYQGNCVPLSGVYAWYDNYSELIFKSICPPFVVLVLANLLMRSVREINHRRITPVNNISSIIMTNRSLIKQRDSQLTFMLILQSLIALITYIPYAVCLIYIEITRYSFKSSLKVAMENIFIELAHLLSYVFFASSFYVSICTNIGFRRHTKRFLWKENDRNSHIM